MSSTDARTSSPDAPVRVGSVAPPGWSPTGPAVAPASWSHTGSAVAQASWSATRPVVDPATAFAAPAPVPQLPEGELIDGPLPHSRDSVEAPTAGWPEPHSGDSVVALTAAWSAPAGSTPEDAAIRWRLRAATFDNVLVYGAYLGVCLLMHWRPLTATHLIAMSVIAVIYHFAFESRGGQTLGKRRYGIQVVDVGGGLAGPKAIALRSVLRAIDQLPVWYLSGLISMVRTGAARRQRIGDVAANTKVIAVGGRAATRGTPGWYLPAATVAALLTSLLMAWAAVHARTSPLSDAQRAQFVAGCEVSASGQTCTCLLNQLQAEGFDSLSSMGALVRQSEAAMVAGRPDAVPPAMVQAVRACAQS